MSSLKILPDTQNKPDSRGLSIPKVGIRDLKLPFKVYCKNGGEQEVIAICSVYTDLSKKLKGISMSPLVIHLHDLHSVLTPRYINKFLSTLKEKTGSNNCYVKWKFDFKKLVQAPISKEEGYKFYLCEIEGKLIDDKIEKYLTVNVSYLSTCPCSAELANTIKIEKHIQAYPHQQRSIATITVPLNDGVYIEDIIKYAEKAAFNVPYTIIKRCDEREITARSGRALIFVEDIVRDLALEFNKHDQIKDFVIVCNHEESLHQHIAVAIIRKGEELK